MEMDCQFISIYEKFVTTQTTSFSRVDIRQYYLQISTRNISAPIPVCYETVKYLLFYEWNKLAVACLKRAYLIYIL